LTETNYKEKQTKDMEDELIDFIRKTTRAVQFNFEEVAQIINTTYRPSAGGSHEGREMLPLTPQQCREIFANDYNQTMKPPRDDSKMKAETPTSAATTASIAVSEESLTYHEILQQHEYLKNENNKKINAVFKRVLGVLETTEKVDLDENDEVVMAHRHRMESEEIERQRKILLAEEQRELEAFEIQRAKLKKRFDAGSEDAEGVDPLSQRSQRIILFQQPLFFTFLNLHRS
jgi:hypothetical protein